MGRCSLTRDRRGKVPKPRKRKDPQSEGGRREGGVCRGWWPVDGGKAGRVAGSTQGPQHGVWRRPSCGEQLSAHTGRWHA